MEKKILETYKKDRITEFELPSGLKVKIKELTPYHLLKIRKELDLTIDDEIYRLDVIEKLFSLSLVEPKVPDDLELGDFTKDDYTKLHEIIWNYVTFIE